MLLDTHQVNVSQYNTQKRENLLKKPLSFQILPELLHFIIISSFAIIKNGLLEKLFEKCKNFVTYPPLLPVIHCCVFRLGVCSPRH